MRNRFIQGVVVASLVGCLDGAGQSDLENRERQGVSSPRDVLICHVPPGNPGNARSLSVPGAAVRAHLAHGDRLGACGPTCAPEGAACASAGDCCRGGCVASVCTLACVPGSTASCYSGPTGTSGVGVCVAGTRTCNPDGSGYGACSGEVTPSAEVCGDGLDNDCDGGTDEGCVCAPGASQACYDGPTSTEGVGACRAGTQTCNGVGTGYGACVGAVGPSPEVCGDGVDNDCDGTIDDGCVCAPGASQGCYDLPTGAAGVGVCAAGTQTCNATGTAWGACVGAVGPSAEVCGDGLDNDCDGGADEGCVCAPGASQACYDLPTGTAGVGACRAGTQTCNGAGTGYGACVGAVGPSPEVCGDGVDNDCDGTIDDGCVCAPGASQACYDLPTGTAGVGVCRAGTQTCNGAGTGYGACAGAVGPSPEVCGDGVDNDCDGTIDDGCLGDRVWNDRDRDGIQDLGESGLGGATIILRTSSGSVVSVAVSAASGSYSFSNIPPGSYYMEIIPPFSYTISSTDAGGDDSVDNDFDAETGATSVFTYTGAPEASYDCGVYFVIMM